jgi:hypothetical protein
LTEHGTIRSFSMEKRSYFEKERPVEIYNDQDASSVEREESAHDASSNIDREN